jgi:peptide/nickel transport system permease protein
VIKYVGRRLLTLVPVLIGVSIVVFIFVHLMPGDVAEAVLGAGATAEQLEAYRRDLGLDQPILIQYGVWLSRVLLGNFGYSVSLSIPVADILWERLFNTMILTLAAFVLAVGIGIVAGVWAARRHRSWLDHGLVIFSVLDASAPPFWVGLVLMSIFAYQLGILPAIGMYDARNPGGLADLLAHLVLPAVTAAAVPMAVIARLVRSEIIDQLQKPYIIALRARGVPEGVIAVRHAFRNSLPNLLNIIGLQVGYLLGGAFFSEVVFNWPGLGLLVYQAIVARDIPVVQSAVLTIALVFVAINLITDALAILLDPRARHTLEAER